MLNEIKNLSKLNKLLTCDNLPQNRSEYLDYFKEIARILMNKCAVSKGGINYEIVEIEFYLFTPNHPDVITYPRETEAGQWFFHQSGVDLTFKSTDKQFGGILVRGLRCGGRLILGPQKCVDELWNKFDAFEVNSKEYPFIKECSDILEKELTPCPRHIPLYGKTPYAKIEGWTARISSPFKADSSIEERAELVFDSNYRFFKKDSINQSD